jgi:hypothetical protein
MNTRLWLAFVAAGCLLPAQVKPLEESGFTPIFDGKSLNGWDCDPAFWRVENAAITGESTKTHQPPYNIFCIWKGGKPGDFELKLQYKLTGAGGNSGIQYRSVELTRRRQRANEGLSGGYRRPSELHGAGLRGTQPRLPCVAGADFLYTGRQGSRARIGVSGYGADQLKAFIKNNDWNELDIVARGNTLIQMMNGHVP